MNQRVIEEHQAGGVESVIGERYTSVFLNSQSCLFSHCGSNVQNYRSENLKLVEAVEEAKV